METKTESNSESAVFDEEEEDSEDEDESSLEAQYEKYRDDQMNTGVIAALLGGFALTNSWEMQIEDDSANIDLAAYVLAIVSVHACTCSALASAFFYRLFTLKTPKGAKEWVKKHHYLAQLPWYKFLGGVLAYIASVMLVAWSTLQVNMTARGITLFSGLCSCSLLAYTCLVSFYGHEDVEDLYAKTSAYIQKQNEDSYAGAKAQKRIPNSEKKRKRKLPSYTVR